MHGSRRVNVLRAPQWRERRLVASTFCFRGSGFSRHHAVYELKDHLARHQPLNCIVTLSAWEKRLLLTPQLLWANPHSPHLHRDEPMKPASPQPFFFSSKINERCHCSAHSTLAIRAVFLKEILAPQANPCASVSPNNILFSSSNSSARILNRTEVQVAGKSQLLMLNLCTSDLAHSTFHPHSTFMIYSRHIFIHSNLLLIHQSATATTTL